MPETPVNGLIPAYCGGKLFSTISLANHQAGKHLFPQTPSVGITDMVYPSLDAGIEYGKADSPRMVGFQPLTQVPGGAAHFTRLDSAVSEVYYKPQPRNACFYRDNLGRLAVDG